MLFGLPFTARDSLTHRSPLTNTSAKPNTNTAARTQQCALTKKREKPFGSLSATLSGARERPLSFFVILIFRQFRPLRLFRSPSSPPPISTVVAAEGAGRQKVKPVYLLKWHCAVDICVDPGGDSEKNYPSRQLALRLAAAAASSSSFQYCKSVVIAI